MRILWVVGLVHCLLLYHYQVLSVLLGCLFVRMRKGGRCCLNSAEDRSYILCPSTDNDATGVRTSGTFDLENMCSSVGELGSDSDNTSSIKVELAYAQMKVKESVSRDRNNKHSSSDKRQVSSVDNSQGNIDNSVFCMDEIHCDDDILFDEIVTSKSGNATSRF